MDALPNPFTPGDLAPNQTITGTVRPGRVTAILLAIIGLFGLLHAVFVIWLGYKPKELTHSKLDHGYNYLVSLFNLAADSSIGNFFSALLLATVAALLLFIYRRIQPALQWLVLSLVFAFLSIDEACRVHERFGGLLGSAVKERAAVNSDFLQWSWVIPYAVFVVGLAAYLLPFVWRLTAKIKWQFFLAAAIYVGAALGIEVIESFFEARMGSGNNYNKVLFLVEETMEMVGIAIFIRALLQFCSLNKTALLVKLKTI